MSRLQKIKSYIKSWFYRLTEASLGLAFVLYGLIEFNLVPTNYVEPSKRVVFWVVMLGVLRGLKYLPKNRVLLKKVLNKAVASPNEDAV